jgi:hypothetical protein
MKSEMGVKGNIVESVQKKYNFLISKILLQFKKPCTLVFDFEGAGAHFNGHNP